MERREEKKNGREGDKQEEGLGINVGRSICLRVLVSTIRILASPKSGRDNGYSY